MKKSNIIYNIKSLNEYEKKYGKFTSQLMKFSKQEVEEFDKASPTGEKNVVLKKRNWALIGNTYYELPKAPRFSWFKGLTKKGKIIACSVLVGGAAVAATAITLPLVITEKDKELTIEEGLEYVKKHYVAKQYETKTHDGDLDFALSISNVGKTLLDNTPIGVKGFMEELIYDIVDVDSDNPEYESIKTKLDNNIKISGNNVSLKLALSFSDDSNFNSLSYIRDDETKTTYEKIIEEDFVNDSTNKPRVFLKNNKLRITGTYYKEASMGATIKMKVTDCTYQYNEKGVLTSVSFNFNNKSKCEFCSPDISGYEKYQTLFTGTGKLKGIFNY